MKKCYGISFNLTLSKRGFPTLIIMSLPRTTLRPKTIYEDDYGHPIVGITTWGGIRLDIVFGQLYYPLRKIFKFKNWYDAPDANPWISGNHWFVVNIPFIAGFFLSAYVGKKGFHPGGYIGLKSYRIDETSNAGKWADPKKVGDICLCFSMSARDDMIQDAF